MAEPTGRVSITGTWSRHVLAGADGLAASRGPNGGRFNGPDRPALYLADDDATAWAEWYRWLAEWGQSPADHLPRDLYRITVDLAHVVDASSATARTTLGLPIRMRPSSRQWSAFRAVGERLAAEGAHGIRYASAARTRSLCLCVFEPGLAGLRIESAPVRVIAPPPPPRGLRT